jgi:predicted nucleotidyltransferase
MLGRFYGMARLAWETGVAGGETWATPRARAIRCYSALGKAMESLIERHLGEIANLCRRFAVRRLAAFGSILREDFDPVQSDADFLVEFEPLPAAVRIQNYLNLREALGSLLSRRIDLVEDGSIRNPYILRKVNEQQRLLYAA